MASLQKNTNYDNLGFRVDNKGIATDTKTGNTLSREDVNSRLAGSDLTNFTHKRGGVAGVWDRNKKEITLGAEIIPALVATIASGGTASPLLLSALGAGTGAAIKGFDQEGKSGINFGAKDALRGAMEGMSRAGLGTMAGGLANSALGLGANAAGTASEFGDIANAGKTFGSNPIPELPSAAGQSFEDWAKGHYEPSSRSNWGINGRYTPTMEGMKSAPKSILKLPSMPEVPNVAQPSALSRFGSTLGNIGSSAMNKLGQVGDWAQAHPVMMNALDKAADNMFPTADKVANARLANAQANQVDFNTQRMQDSTAANQKLADSLKAQLAAMMTGNYRPNVAQSAYPTRFNG